MGSLTILWFSNSLGGITKLRIVVMLIIIVYYSEKMQIKSSTGKMFIRKSPERDVTFQCLLPVELHG